MAFCIPKSKHKYLFEQSMFETIWIVYSVLSIFFLILGIKHYVTNNPNFYTFVGVFIMTLVSLLIMKKKGKYYIPVIFGVVGGTIFCQYSVFFVTDYSGIVDLLWIVLISLFAFYGLGSKWGFLVFVVNMLGLVYNYIIVFNELNLNENDKISEFNTLVNVTIATLTISFLIHRIIQSSVKANRDFQKANIQLHEQNELVQAQSNEKTILLQEIHHRVKNNLQVISSLIRLQSYETEDAKIQQLFESSVNRIAAMALIHEKMYQGDNVSKINLEDYLVGLANDIFRSYSTNTKVDYNVKSEFEIIGNRTIVPLALILNELITNSLKHAFTNQENGEIKVEIKLLNDNHFSLDYYDSGVWKDNQKTSTFGTDLIRTFTEQLDGELTRISDENGTHYTFKLKNID